MKKFALYDPFGERFLHNIIFIASLREIHCLPASDPSDILYYDTVAEPLLIFNFLAEISDGKICLTVAEVEVND